MKRTKIIRMKRRYTVGQWITLPAIKSERIPACRARVVGLPNGNGLMEVARYGAEEDETFEVAVSKKTGRVRAVLCDCACF